MTKGKAFLMLFFGLTSINKNYKQLNNIKPKQMKNKTAAGLLALFLGGLGVHKFYLGQGGVGIIYLLFFWTFIPALLALYDGIVLLTMEDNLFNEKYNGGKVSSFSNVNTAEELEKLHTLMEKGIITEYEFQKRKEKLL